MPIDPNDARESKRKADMVAALQPPVDMAAAAQDEADMRRMLARMAHKRKCHALGHLRVSQCERCVERRCEVCAAPPDERLRNKDGEPLPCMRLATHPLPCVETRCDDCAIEPCASCEGRCRECDAAKPHGALLRKAAAEAATVPLVTLERTGKRAFVKHRDPARAWLEAQGETFDRKGALATPERTPEETLRAKLAAIARTLREG